MRKYLSLISLIIVIILVFSGCGKKDDGGKVVEKIKIGYINPTTGALAGNGEGCEWVVKQITDYVDSHPITVDGKQKSIEVIVYDSMSDQNNCSTLTQKLIEEDKIDLLIAIQTPNTVIPVVQVAERYGMPCIATQAPVDPVAHSLEKFDWTFNAFYTLEDVYKSQRALWTKAGHGPGSGAKVGLLFANDADGTAWHNLFIERLAEDGYEVVDPGQYPSGTTDFTSLANTFKAKDIDVIAGTNIPPDFMNAYNAIIAAGVQVDCVTMGKCVLLASDVEALGELADGIMTQVWWAPTNPYTSDLTGVSCLKLDEMYNKDNGRVMPQPAAYAYAALELAVHALEKAGTVEREKLRDAIGQLDVTTIVGPIKYDSKMEGLTYSNTVLCGGQWQRDEAGNLVLKIIDNSLYPEIPLTGDYVPGNATQR